MKKQTLRLLKCIQCGSSRLEVNVFKSSDQSIQKGIITCKCGFYYLIGRKIEGILEALPPYFRDLNSERSFLENQGFTSKLNLREWQLDKRNVWLVEQFKEAMKAYEKPGEAWSVDELEMMPLFLRLLKRDGIVLDLAGGYGRCTPYFLEKARLAVIGDLSIDELKVAKENLENLSIDFIQLDMFNLPFKDEAFDGIWITQAFEYVPPDKLDRFIEALSSVLKSQGVIFCNIEKKPFITLLSSYIKFKLKGAPIKFGEHPYTLRGGLLHYHSTPSYSVKKLERIFEDNYLSIVCKRDYSVQGSYPLVYLLQKA